MVVCGGKERENYGILTPVIVAGPDDSGLYEIMEGEQRFHAISRCFGVSRRYARMYKTIVMSGVPELIGAVKCTLSQSGQTKIIDNLKQEGMRKPIVKVHIPLTIALNIIGKERPQAEQRKILYLIYSGCDAKTVLKDINLRQDLKLTDQTISKALKGAVEGI